MTKSKQNETEKTETVETEKTVNTVMDGFGNDLTINDKTNVIETVNGQTVPDVIGTEFVSVIVSYETGRLVPPKRLRSILRSNNIRIGSGSKHTFGRIEPETGQYTKTIKRIIQFVLETNSGSVSSKLNFGTTKTDRPLTVIE